MTTNETTIGTTKYDDRGTGPSGIVPDLEGRSVVAIFDRWADAEVAAQALQSAGYAGNEISVVRSGEGNAPQMDAEDTHAGKGIAAGATAGAVVGGAVGLAALALTGVGALLAAGPIVAALAGGAATGGAMGALVGSLAGLGVPTADAERYGAAVRAGGVLVAVKVQDNSAAQHVADLMCEHNARDVNSFHPSM